MREIKNGVYYTYTPSTKYKSNLLVIKLIAPYNIKRASIRALLSRLFEDGSEAIKNKSILEKKLADLYGATLSVSVQRKGNFHEFSLTSSIARPKLLNDNIDKLVEDWFKLIYSILFEQNFDQNNSELVASFQREKQMLLSLLERDKDDKASLVIEKLMERLYENAEVYYAEGLGNEAAINSATLGDLKREYETMINDSLILIGVHGEFINDPLEQEISNWPLPPRSSNISYLDNYISTKQIEEEITVEKVDGQQTYLALAYYIPMAITLRQKILTQVLNGILGSLPNSVLFTEVRESEGLAYSICSSVDYSRHLLIIEAGIDGEQIETVLSAIKQQLNTINQKLLDSNFLNEAKLTLLSNEIQSRDSQAVELYLEFNQILKPGIDFTFENYHHIIETLQPDDIASLLAKVKPSIGVVLKGCEADD